MKTILQVFFSISLLFILSDHIYAQSDSELPHAVINIVRSNNFFGSGCRSDITLQNQREFNLSLNSIVKYTIYSEGEITITVDVFCPGTQNTSPSSFSKQTSLNVTRGNEYYVLYTAGKFNVVTKEEVQKYLDKSKNVMKQEENLDFPINRESVKNIAKNEGKGQGTCFLISSGGYLITNFHCVENAKEINIKGIDGDFTTKYGAVLIASDPSNDLALLKLSNKNLKLINPPFAFRSSGVAQGEKVYALGFPMAKNMGDEMKITDGIISARSGAQGDISKYQISAVVNPGNSGGPLIDEDGNLIGVIYAKSAIADAAGYAIKSSYLEAFLKNVDGFEYPALLNLLKEKPLTMKITELKNFIFILESN